MHQKKTCTIFCLLFFLVSILSKAQNFYKEIQVFQKQDSIQTPPSNAILFIGSSSFTNWKNVQEYFPNATIINRGFGGSTLLDVVHYQQQVIFKYNPRKIIIYCGENDIAYSDTLTTNTVLQRFTTLFFSIRKQYKKIPIVFVSIKPSAARWNLRTRFIEANNYIQNFLKTQKYAHYVNVWNAMLTNNYPTAAIFGKDSLHMNSSGYAIWQQLLQPHLK